MRLSLPRPFGHLALIGIALTLLAGCSSMKIEDFADKTPSLVLEDYFEGRTRAWGIFEDRFGNLRREFTVDITGTWNGKTLVLDEDFVYADGEIDKRIWTIEKKGPGLYEGRADDVIGTATGKTAGNALHWAYDLNLKVGDSTWKVHFDDWMFLQPDDMLFNRATVTKWGFEIGQVTLVFRPWPE
ncbi:MAG: DUF3833 domain-containing protein [Magnetovibrionaceae bacterium]